MGIFWRKVPILNVFVYKQKAPKGFVYVPAGEFTMSSTKYEEEPITGDPDDNKPHKVTLTKGFYIDRYEVTQEEWESLIGNNPSSNIKCGKNCPVENISWEDTQAFLYKYNEKHGGGYRLPTEAEWEYAALAGRTPVKKKVGKDLLVVLIIIIWIVGGGIVEIVMEQLTLLDLSNPMTWDCMTC